MPRTHSIPLLGHLPLPVDDPAWRSIPALSIDSYPWATVYPYRPVTTAQLVRCPDRWVVRMETDEQPLLARARKMNEDVFKDSCMEFFVQPDDRDDRYLNFEFNPFGTLLLGLGPDRASRVRLTLDPTPLAIQSRYDNTAWAIRWEIPDSVLQALGFGGHTQAFRGNFYKCSDETVHPHYGSWSPIECPAPDFHRPADFGEFVVLS
jgi:hypothetical protein